MPLFTLKGVETGKNPGGIKNLIKSTKKLIMKPKQDGILQERAGFHSILKTRFNIAFLDKKGEEYPIDCTYPCDWCRRYFEHVPVGIPIKYNKLVNGESHYFMDGWLCSFECALAFVFNENLKSSRFSDPIYKDSEYLIVNLYNKLYPGSEPLKKAPDWRLFRDNGGDLDELELSGEYKQHIYYRTPNVKITPLCVIYQS